MTEPLSIRELFAWTMRDAEGDEGMLTMLNPMTQVLIPLVGADMERMHALQFHAQRCADSEGRPVSLARFTVREEVLTLIPRSDDAEDAPALPRN